MTDPKLLAEAVERLRREVGGRRLTVEDQRDIGIVLNALAEREATPHPAAEPVDGGLHPLAASYLDAQEAWSRHFQAGGAADQPKAGRLCDASCAAYQDWTAADYPRLATDPTTPAKGEGGSRG